MPEKPQGGKLLRKALKRRMIDREQSVGSLAKQLGHDISVVSKAINHGHYPRVVKKIMEALSV